MLIGHDEYVIFSLAKFSWQKTSNIIPLHGWLLVCIIRPEEKTECTDEGWKKETKQLLWLVFQFIYQTADSFLCIY